MKTKNTKELRLRAAAHARADHVKQGTYGRGYTNGHTEYKGCAIGCLTTPHRKRDLITFIKSFRFYDEINYSVDTYTDSIELRKQLSREFGLCKQLVYLAEAFFEAQTTHGAAINFVRDFGAAVPEGKKFTPKQCNKFCEGLLGVDAEFWPSVRSSVWGRGDVGVDTAKFLAWVAA